MTLGTAIIVGVGPGLGFAVANAFAMGGHPVALLSRSSGPLDIIESQLKSSGFLARGYAADATDPDQLRDAIRTAVVELGAPDVLVYNAALVREDTPTDGDTAGWAAALAVDMLGAKVATEAVLPALRNGRGSLLFTSGGLAVAPSPQFASLSVGKAALRAYVSALHVQMQGTEVRATSIRIGGHIGGGEDRFAPDTIARAYVALHHEAQDAWVDELIID
jgi:NADP-dependent 3-hydroxy acid dehydrogenase YdfG